MLNILRLLKSVKIKFYKDLVVIDYKCLSIVISNNKLTIVVNGDVDLHTRQDLMISSDCYIGLNSTRKDIDILQNILKDGTQKTSRKCTVTAL